MVVYSVGSPECSCDVWVVRHAFSAIAAQVLRFCSSHSTVCWLRSTQHLSSAVMHEDLHMHSRLVMSLMCSWQWKEQLFIAGRQQHTFRAGVAGAARREVRRVGRVIVRETRYVRVTPVKACRVSQWGAGTLHMHTAGAADPARLRKCRMSCCTLAASLSCCNGRSYTEQTHTRQVAAVRARGLDNEWSWHDAVVGEHWDRRASALCSSEAEVELDFVDVDLQ